MNYREILEKNKINIIEKSSIYDLFRDPQPLFKYEKRFQRQKIEGEIFDILMNPVIRRGDGVLTSETEAKYFEQMKKFINEEKPIETVLLGFPFKCHNPVETIRKTPDLGELAFLYRLADINETVKQAYSPGIKFNVLLEGRAYANLFGATESEISEFESTLMSLVNKLGINELIEFNDFAAECSKYADFSDVKAEEEKRIREFNQADRGEIDKLMYVMARSLPVLEGIPISDLLKVYDSFQNKEIELNNFQIKLKEYLFLGSEDLAISYLSFQKAKNRLNVIPDLFSDQLYISTTVKPTRYSLHPIHRKTRMFPHHGVPVLGSDKVDVVYLKEILENPSNYSAVFCDEDSEDAPFYFLKGKQHTRS
jgi:pyoverdine/dityrosine biosynthesis protein Dit1